MLSREDFYMIKEMKEQGAHLVDIAHKVGCSGRTNDNWAMGLGMVLFWPALFALDGGDGPEATEYAQVKGEYEALRQNSVEKSCNINMQSPDEILESARRADQGQPVTTELTQWAGSDSERGSKRIY